MATSSKTARARASAAARRRGSDFEKRVANRLGGYVWSGEDGDVEARGYRVECKYRDNLSLDTTFELRDFHEQILRYQRLPKNKDKPFLFAYTGGQKQRGEIWISMPIDEFIRLSDLDEDSHTLDRFREKYPEHIDRLTVLFDQTVKDALNAESSLARQDI